MIKRRIAVIQSTWKKQVDTTEFEKANRKQPNMETRIQHYLL